MKTNAVHETFRLLPADSVAYRCNRPVFGRKTKNPPMAAHLRWAEAMNDPQWGWRVAMTHHASEEPLPPSLRDPYIRRAYRYLHGNRDDQMAVARALKESSHCDKTRRVLQGLLCARDISIQGIASLLELDPEVVRLFEALFFKVRERGEAFRTGVMFPEARIGAIALTTLSRPTNLSNFQQFAVRGVPLSLRCHSERPLNVMDTTCEVSTVTDRAALRGAQGCSRFHLEPSSGFGQATATL
jgi:hypothetical protein